MCHCVTSLLQIQAHFSLQLSSCKICSVEPKETKRNQTGKRTEKERNAKERKESKGRRRG